MVASRKLQLRLLLSLVGANTRSGEEQVPVADQRPSARRRVEVALVANSTTVARHWKFAARRLKTCRSYEE